MDKIIKIKCVTCASPVLLNKSDEGTCFYTPLYRGEDVRELLVTSRRAVKTIKLLYERVFPHHDIAKSDYVESLEAALSKFHIDNETPPEVKSV